MKQTDLREKGVQDTLIPGITEISDILNFE